MWCMAPTLGFNVVLGAKDRGARSVVASPGCWQSTWEKGKAATYELFFSAACIVPNLSAKSRYCTCCVVGRLPSFCVVHAIVGARTHNVFLRVLGNTPSPWSCYDNSTRTSVLTVTVDVISGNSILPQCLGRTKSAGGVLHGSPFLFFGSAATSAVWSGQLKASRLATDQYKNKQKTGCLPSRKTASCQGASDEEVSGKS